MSGVVEELMSRKIGIIVVRLLHVIANSAERAWAFHLLPPLFPQTPWKAEGSSRVDFGKGGGRNHRASLCK